MIAVQSVISKQLLNIFYFLLNNLVTNRGPYQIIGYGVDAHKMSP